MTPIFLLLLLALGIYSYSQIDLNLTLLQTNWFLAFQSQMIQLGYFNRWLSAVVFVALTVIFFVLYIIFLRRADRLTTKNIIILMSAVTVLGLFSYPAFSHDIFNYIFDARIAVFYHANPYTATALMFPFDTWTRFMQWTHRSYPYGPAFLPISFLFYSLGLGKFTLTLLWFKGMAVGAYLGCAYILYKLTKTKGLLFFALNPLVIYEGVVAGHLDIVMLFFALLGYCLFIGKRKALGLLTFLLSIGIKYATAFQLPALFLKKRREMALILLAYAGALVQIASREVLPHYFLVSLGFSALLVNNKYVVWAGIILSALLLILRYYPFILTGQWPRYF